MKEKPRAAALLRIWSLVGTSWLAAALTFSAVHASRIGCIQPDLADLVSVGGIGGVGLASASLVLVGAVPTYRSGPRAAAALTALALSVYAIVALLTRDGAICA